MLWGGCLGVFAMSIHAVDKKSEFFCVESGLKLIYFLVICVNWMVSKNRGILLNEIWKPRKRLSVATVVTKYHITVIKHLKRQSSTQGLAYCHKFSQVRRENPSEALTASSLGYFAANRIFNSWKAWVDLFICRMSANLNDLVRRNISVQEAN